MAKFKFQLEAVDQVRSLKEQKMLEELSVAQKNYLQKIELKKEILSKKQSAFINKNDLISRDANINDIRLMEDYIVGLNAHLIRAEQAIVRARRFLEQAMRHYLKAKKEKMMIDRLREKAAHEFQLEQSRLEQKRVDDLITMRTRLNHGPIQDEEEIA